MDWTRLPKPLPNRKKGNMFDAGETMNSNIDRTLGLLVSGKDCKGVDLTHGNMYAFQNGTCDETSEDPCVGEPRYIEVNNMGKMSPCVTTCNMLGTGLIPSLIADIFEFRPTAFAANMSGKGPNVNSSCRLKTVNHVQKYAGESGRLFDSKAVCVPKTPILCKDPRESKSIEPFCGNMSRINTFLIVGVLFACVVYIVFSNSINRG